MGQQGLSRPDRPATTDCWEPIPFSPRTSAEYAALRFRDRQPTLYRRQLDKLWAQDRDEAYERFFGASLDAVLAQPSISSEERGNLAEPSRFGTLARRVFQPLLGRRAAMISDHPPFDLCDELPSGTTVLEASAGTGKTYTIAALTARHR